MTRRYTTRGLWVIAHGEEVKRLWRETDMPAREIGQMFGVSKGSITGFVYRQKDTVRPARIAPSVKNRINNPVTGIDTSRIDDELTEISQYRHDTTKMLSCAARLCGVSVSELTEANVRAGAKRKWRASYLMRRMGLSYPRIGQLINRDQSTAQYGVKRFQATIDANRAKANRAEAIRA